MKKRLKILVMTGVLSLSAVGTVEFTFAEETTESEAKAANEGKEQTNDVTEPTEPTQPEQPTEPTQPEQPTEPAQPEQPTEPAQPEQPTEPTQPEQPTEPAQPEQPTESTEPTTPEAPTEAETSQTEKETSSESESETEKATEKKEKEKIDEEAAQLYEQATGESIYVFGSYPVGDITENTNEIYDYLRNVLGLNHAAACGVLANIQCESNFASSAVGDGGTSYGLCQWHLGRFSALINWCNANGYEYHSIQGQLGYLTTELQGGYASVYQYLLSVPDTAQGAYDAAYYWCKYFEIPANLEYNSQMRADLAMNLYYPKVLGTQKETEETEITTLNDAQMEQVLISAPESIGKLSRLDVSKEDTVDQVLQDAGISTEQEGSAAHMRELKVEAQKAVEQALADYEQKDTKTPTSVEEEDVSVMGQITLTAEELAMLGNTIF